MESDEGTTIINDPAKHKTNAGEISGLDGDFEALPDRHGLEEIEEFGELLLIVAIVLIGESVLLRLPEGQSETLSGRSVREEINRDKTLLGFGCGNDAFAIEFDTFLDLVQLDVKLG
jgi:hypothetical protein